MFLPFRLSSRIWRMKSQRKFRLPTVRTFSTLAVASCCWRRLTQSHCLMCSRRGESMGTACVFCFDCCSITLLLLLSYKMINYHDKKSLFIGYLWKILRRKITIKLSNVSPSGSWPVWRSPRWRTSSGQLTCPPWLSSANTSSPSATGSWRTCAPSMRTSASSPAPGTRVESSCTPHPTTSNMPSLMGQFF